MHSRLPVHPPSSLPPRASTQALDADRIARDLTTRPIRELRTLQLAVVPTVLGTLLVGLLCAVVPALLYPVHAVVALVGAVAGVVAAVGAFMLSEHPACATLWGNHKTLTRFVHGWAPIGMLAWVGVFVAMLVSRAEATVGTTAPDWLKSLAPFSWYVYLPCFVAGSLGIACVSELLATVARAAQDDSSADRLRFSFLALWLMLLFCIPMWWSILNTWGGPGMIIAVGASILVMACYARFASGYVPMLSTMRWVVLNAQDARAHEARVQSIQASRVRVDQDDAPSPTTSEGGPKGARKAEAQTEPWAKPVFKNSNTLRKPGA